MLVGAFYPGPFTCESPLRVNGLNQILYTMDMASLPEDDFLPKLSQWCHIPRNSFARKDRCEETFSTTCPLPYPLPQGPHPRSWPTFALSPLFFLWMSLYKPIFCPLCHSPDSVQMASGTFKFVPTCPNSGSRCRSQFCICYVIPHSLSYVIKKIDFPRATSRISFKISFLFTL